jgi:protein SCO1/2
VDPLSYGDRVNRRLDSAHEFDVLAGPKAESQRQPAAPIRVFINQRKIEGVMMAGCSGPTQIGEADNTMGSCCSDAGTAQPVTITHRPTATVGGSFSLIDHFGQRVSERSFPGRYALVFFGFTHCRTVCPAALARIDQAMHFLGQDADLLQPLYITVDPARDTPSVMREFLSAGHPRILGLSGTAAEIEKTMHGFRAFAARRDDDADPDGYLMPHSAFTYLMDDEGRYLSHFTDAVDAPEMAQEISTKLEETREHLKREVSND